MRRWLRYSVLGGALAFTVAVWALRGGQPYYGPWEVLLAAVMLATIIGLIGWIAFSR